jgi:hypothetical protein
MNTSSGPVHRPPTATPVSAFWKQLRRRVPMRADSYRPRGQNQWPPCECGRQYVFQRSDTAPQTASYVEVYDVPAGVTPQTPKVKHPGPTYTVAVLPAVWKQT